MVQGSVEVSKATGSGGLFGRYFSEISESSGIWTKMLSGLMSRHCG